MFVVSENLGGYKLYATGARIQSHKIIPDSGEPYWIWAVVDFEDDTYSSDGEICSPRVVADNEDDLIRDNVIEIQEEDN